MVKGKTFNSAIKNLVKRDFEGDEEEEIDPKDPSPSFKACSEYKDDITFLNTMSDLMSDLLLHFAPKEYLLQDSICDKFKVEKSKLQFICHSESLVKDLKPYQLRKLRQMRNFKLSQNLIGNPEVKRAFLSVTVRLSVFVGLQFPSMVATSEEIFEVFHAVHLLYLNFRSYYNC